MGMGNVEARNRGVTIDVLGNLDVDSYHAICIVGALFPVLTWFRHNEAAVVHVDDLV